MQFGIDEFNGRLAGIAISVPHPVQQSRKRWLNFPRVFWVARHFRSVYSGGNRERNRNLEERPRSCHRFEYFSPGSPLYLNEGPIPDGMQPIRRRASYTPAW
jgi:hypothetical protein